MRAWGTLRRAPRPLWVLLAATFLNRAGTMALPFLVLFLTQARHFSDPQAGAMLLAYGAGALVAGPLAGALVPRFGTAWIMRVSLALSAAGPFALPLARSPLAIAVLTFAWALFAESFRPPSLVIVSDLLPASEHRQGFAALRLAGNLGTSIGPAVGGVLASVSFPLLFAIDGATSLLAAAVLFASSFDPASVSDVEPHDNVPPVAKGAALALFLAGATCVAMLFFQCESTMGLYLVGEQRMTTSAYGLLFTVNTVLIVLFEVPLTEAIARWPMRRAIVSGALLVAAGFAAFARVHGFVQASLAVAVWTFGEMLFAPSASAYVTRLAPRARRGAYLGAYNAAWSVALGLGPWLGALSLAHLGGPLHWMAVGFVGLLAAIELAWAVEPDAGDGVNPARARALHGQI